MTQIFVAKKKPTVEDSQETKEQKKKLSEEEELKQQEREEQKKKEEEERQKREQEELQRLEEERRQKAEEERLLRQKKLEEEEQKKYEEGKKKYEEQKKIREERKTLRLTNLQYVQVSQDKKKVTETDLARLENNIKKNTSFIKKIKPVTEEQKDSILKDINTLNLRKYISEIAAAIVEHKIKPSDLNSCVLICSELHQRYIDFDNHLLECLLNLLRGKEDPKAFAKLSDAEKSQKHIWRRSLLRLMTELYTVGFWNQKGATATFAKFFIDMLANFENDIRDGNYFEMTSVISFLRYTSEELLGIPNASNKRYYEEDENRLDPVKEKLITQHEKEHFEKALSTYYDKVSELYIKAYKAISEKEKQHKNMLETKGEISQKSTELLEKMTKAFEKLDGNIKILSELLAKSLPEKPVEEAKAEIENQDISMEQPQQSTTDRSSDSPFDDEDTRAFYQDLPDLIAQLPQGLLGKKKKAVPEENSLPSEPTEAPAETTSSPPEKAPEKEDTETKLLDDEQNNDEEEVTSGKPSPLLELLSKLPDAVNRDQIDDLTLQFCYLNSKKARKRLVDELFQVPRQKVVLVPYYSRMVATLTQVGLKDIGPALVQKLESEFNWLFYKKDQLNIETKIKNIRFLAELVKFEVCPEKNIFQIWTKLMGDFSHHNIDVVCTLLECCGRFLYKIYQVKTKNLLDIMMKKKQTAIHMDPRRATAIENAFFTCIPPERTVSKKPPLPPLFQYIQKLLYVDLNSSNTREISTQLAKLPWKPDGDQQFLLNAFLKLHKAKYENIELLAHLIQTLLKNATSNQQCFAIQLVDRLIEQIFQGMETRDFKKQQKMIMNVKFLGELFNYYIIEEPTVIFDMLGNILNYGHRAPPMPQTPSPQQIKAFKQFVDRQLFLDPRDDFFRVRMICTLLDTCSKYFDSGHSRLRLRLFMLYFQKYLLCKEKPPMDVEFMISDCFENLPLDVPRHDNLEELETQLQKAENDLFIKRSHGESQRRKKLIHNFSLDNLDPSYNPLHIISQNVPFENKEDEEPEEDSSTDESADSEDEDDEDDAEDSLSGEDEEAEEDSSKEEEDPEFTQVQFKKKAEPENNVGAQDLEEFDQLFNQMMKESSEARKQETKYGQKVDLTIPLNLLKGDAKPKDTSASPSMVGVKMLVKKGSKPAAKGLLIPNESKLIQNQQKNKNDEIQERQEINRMVLQYEERQREVDEQIEEEEFKQQPREIVQTLFKPKSRDSQNTGSRSNWKKG